MKRDSLEWVKEKLKKIIVDDKILIDRTSCGTPVFLSVENFSKKYKDIIENTKNKTDLDVAKKIEEKIDVSDKYKKFMEKNKKCFKE